MTTRERVVLSAHLLASIEGERQRRSAPGLFRAVEQEIIWRELADLEAQCGRGSGPANSPPVKERFS